MASHTPTPGPGGGDPRPPTRRTLGAGSAFAAAVAAFAVVMMGTTLPTPLYAIYGAELGFGVTTTTVIFAVYAAGVIAALIVFGRWSDVIGRRPLLLAGVVISAISAVVFVTAGGLAELLAGRVISGLSAGIYTGTATAAVIELAPRSWQSRAPAIATAANMGGLGLGPLVAGILAQYVPAPLHTVFVVDLVALAVVGVAIWFVAEPARLRPGARLGVQRLSVPPQVREVFTGPAIAAFAGFAVLGTFTAVAPSFLAKVIGIDNHAAAGALVAVLLASSATIQILGRHAPTGAALITGCATLVVGVAVLAWSLAAASLTLMIVGAVIAGAGQGISFSKGMAAVVAASPPDRRAEVTSTYFVVAYIALSVPIIGQGIAAAHWGLVTAGIAFDIGVGVLCAVAMVLIAVALRRGRTAGRDSATS
ncbi:putative major facilitator superfamily transporter [Gordonia polyisoprenivorans VH2]|uniref:Putative major facilitator superfamily transporter n=1 Tax=Gordonia polyisoprenivorans (strain DSM 44266 / VH2) TaxID=1112204 RepID=H6MZ84_GORPV|nr:MFS transporter [Gordonia polyisoprenivorans]AFA74420.1 putative major facilitator superfamily transporter [Gordonia polyisoprenivorans VH2]OZC31435.1 MFS transporter [Gordonia polyisoprenivorans]UZF54790.1 MFS transporter [Gordonia polyisoprenivorans]